MSAGGLRYSRVRQRLQREGEIGGGLKTLLRIFLQAAMDHSLQGHRSVGREVRNRWRLLVQNRGHRIGRRGLLKRLLPHHHLVEDGSEGEDVRAVVGRQSTHLLWRHVADGSHGDAGKRERRGLIHHRFFRLNEFGEAEVENLDATVFGDEQVVGLQVAVDDSFFVRGGESVRDLHSVVDRLAQRQRPAPESLGKRLAFEQF